MTVKPLILPSFSSPFTLATGLYPSDPISPSIAWRVRQSSFFMSPNSGTFSLHIGSALAGLVAAKKANAADVINLLIMILSHSLNYYVNTYAELGP